MHPTDAGSIPAGGSRRTVRFRINGRGHGCDGVLLAAWGMICAEADGDSRLTFGHDPAVGQGPWTWEGSR